MIRSFFVYNLLIIVYIDIIQQLLYNVTVIKKRLQEIFKKEEIRNEVSNKQMER